MPSAPARGQVLINIEDKDVVIDPAGGRVTLDVTFLDTPPSETPPGVVLGGYGLAPVLEKVGAGPVALRFTSPYIEMGDPFVFPSPDLYVDSVNAAGTAAVLSVLERSDGVRLPETPVNAGRLILEYGPGAAPGEYRVRLDPNATVLVMAEPHGLPHFPSADLSDVGVIRLVPEPGALWFMAVGAALILRRRRTL